MTKTNRLMRTSIGQSNSLNKSQRKYPHILHLHIGHVVRQRSATIFGDIHIFISPPYDNNQINRFTIGRGKAIAL